MGYAVAHTSYESGDLSLVRLQDPIQLNTYSEPETDIENREKKECYTVKRFSSRSKYFTAAKMGRTAKLGIWVSCANLFNWRSPGSILFGRVSFALSDPDDSARISIGVMQY